MDRPGQPQAHADLIAALEHVRAGRLKEALALFHNVLAADPNHVDALHHAGVILAQHGDPNKGERLIAAALALKDDVAFIWSNHGNALCRLGRNEEALTSYGRALNIDPDHADALFNRANVLIELDRAEAALADYRRAAVLPSMHPHMLVGPGNALLKLERYHDALAEFDQVLARMPGQVDAIVGRAIALKELERFDEAVVGFDKALSMVQGYVPALLGRAHAFIRMGKPTDTLPVLDKIVQQLPDNAEAWYMRGHAMLALSDQAAALVSFERAVAIKPGFIEAVFNVADVLRALGRDAEAIKRFKQLLEIAPGHGHALAGLATSAMQICDWKTCRQIAPLLEQKVLNGSRGLIPFSLLSLSSSKDLHLACARSFTKHKCPDPGIRLAPAIPKRRDRIRLGYLSSDFRRHAMGYQMVELFELHDRSRFEIIGFSAGLDDGSQIRARIAAAFDDFRDVSRMSNEAIARAMHAYGVDIAVDLNGHTLNSRLGALAWRPAPVQATYLGFPGTCGAPFIDYVIADEVVIPAEDEQYFSEAVVRLPGCYQVSDRKRRIAQSRPTRAACGLPETGFVFACFNAAYKITPEMFAVWARILMACPGSVLWLVRASDGAVQNLRSAADEQGLAPDRLVFCSHMEPEEHLARHALADLFLDTLPYNSHGTGSFALWGGLPILTCLGDTFAGRVAASLLYGIGLPELVTRSVEEYEAVAIRLASDPGMIAELRRRLALNLKCAPLFNTDLFRDTVEKAYSMMWESVLRGERPSSFSVQM